MRMHGARADDLAAGPTAAWRRTLAGAARRTRALFDEGRPLCEAVTGRLRYELRATWLGGIRILDRLEASGYDAIGHRPVLRPVDVPWFAWRLLAWPLGAARPAPRVDTVDRP
jgi:phytoene/squalene synthetase